MSYEIEIRQLLKTATGLGKVNWGLSPNNETFPYINIHLISEYGAHTMDGPDNSRFSDIQVDIWHDDFSSLVDIKNDVLSIDGYKGSDITSIQNILLNTVKQGSDTSDAGNILHSYSFDFRVFHSI